MSYASPLQGVAYNRAARGIMPQQAEEYESRKLLFELLTGRACNFQGVFGVADHFEKHLDGNPFNLTADSGGTYAINDEIGGVLKMTNDSTDEDESILHTEGEIFLFSQYKPIIYGARVKLTEAATNQSNVAVGLVSGAVASAMTDSSAGPPSSYSGMLHYKLGGGTVWTAETSLAGTQSTDSDCGAATTATYYDLLGMWMPTSSTSSIAKFWVKADRLDFSDLDASLVHSNTSFTYTSATEMRFIVGVHNGSGAAEVLDVDYAFCWQAY